MTTLINERYEVNLEGKENLLGRGGEGQVYIGKDKTLKTDVAIKVVDITERVFSYTTPSNNIQKLQLEFQKIEQFDHTNVVGYYDWGVFSRKRKIYFATIMDLADSGSLATWTFDNETKKLSEINDFFVGILEGLKYIHDKGIIHRDLKPANILIKKSEKGKFIPLLTDLLTNIGSQANKELVATARFNKTFGTIEYMAPELLGTKDVFVGTMTDLWSFGVMLYEFFKKELPFGTRERGDSPLEIAKQILSKEVDVSGIPKPYDKIFIAVHF
ncbi:serine/threonine-protein kinase [Phaeodactylibacter xiamenensis]|uniref:serine/threonine-protein kinase n=1 Tax=Phaeodactylibacter xiamenensis TaxID=1524460 RepID=UPI003BA9BBD0